MNNQYTAVVERCLDTGLFVGYVPGLPGAHSQGETLEELQGNLKEVLELLFEDAPPVPAAEYVGTQTVALGN
ncbi:MAG: type II toxin-antitoxin system HicB family antitoxin [Gammaproteobacteria bacterium]|nr:type II toxin-antitoxin system HicB family antitoxin [Gammaproteobacteria bacterium]